MQAQDILHFWFEELTPQQHFMKDPALDAAMRVRFEATLQAAARCELFAWRATPAGRLAEILVLDQFSRNIYRDTPQAFAQDALALVLAQELVASASNSHRVAGARPACSMAIVNAPKATNSPCGMKITRVTENTSTNASAINP